MREEDLKKIKQEKEEAKQKQESAAKAQAYEYTEYPGSQDETPSSKFDKKKIMIAVIAGAAVIIFIIIYFAFINGGSDIIVTEKPYDQVRQENKQRYVEESSNISNADTAYSTASDSLLLHIETTDTSWIKILLDDTKVEEFTLFPFSKKDIRAKRNYQLIIGNSAAMHFQLNNKPLNFTGNKREVKFISIDSSGLKYLSSPPNLLIK